MSLCIPGSAGLRIPSPKPALTFGIAGADEMRPPLHNRLELIGGFWCLTAR